MSTESAPTLRRSVRNKRAPDFFKPDETAKRQKVPQTPASENEDPNTHAAVSGSGKTAASSGKKRAVTRKTPKQNKTTPKEAKSKQSKTTNNQQSMRLAKMKEINKQLAALGFKSQKNTGNCARAGIYHGFISFTGQESDLDQVIITGKLNCGHQCRATLREVLVQPDYGGDDYEDGSENATVMCDELREGKTDNEDCYELGLGRTYVTGLCGGQPSFDCGKFHNHCNKCSLFGRCIGDYREMHCKKCGGHYFGSGGRFPCQNCSTSLGALWWM